MYLYLLAHLLIFARIVLCMLLYYIFKLYFLIENYLWYLKFFQRLQWSKTILRNFNILFHCGNWTITYYPCKSLTQWFTFKCNIWSYHYNDLPSGVTFDRTITQTMCLILENITANIIGQCLRMSLIHVR